MKEKVKDKKPAAGDKSNISELNPWPAYIQDRLTIWDKLKAQYDAEIENKPKAPITVTLPDGKTVEALSWKTTAYDVARGIRFYNS